MVKYDRIRPTVFVLMALFMTVAAVTIVQAGEEPYKAVVTIPPQAFLVESIAGERFEVSSMVPEDGSPHSASITPEKIKMIRRAEVYFRVGTPIPFEVNNLPVFRQENPNLKIVNTTRGVELKALDEHYGLKKDEGSSKDKAVDNHVWLSPTNLKKMARNVYQGLMEVADSPEYYEKRYKKLVREITRAEEELATILAGYKERSFIAYHPAWGYFGDEFKLRQKAVQEGGNRPGPRKIREIANFARDNGIGKMIASSQFSPSTAEMVAREFSGSVVTVNPMAKDILDELVRLAKAIAEGYQPKQ